MLRGLFVTGTDTGVGKTVCAAALMHRYRMGSPQQPGHLLGARVGSEGCQTPLRPHSDTSPTLRYWKPVQTGIELDDDTAEVARLGSCPPSEVFAKGIRLREPLSPHLAARHSGQTIALEEVVDLVRGEPTATRWIVEGAGGALVPINENGLMTDLIARLALPALIVSRTTLGTINHTLLTIEALRARSIRVAGVLMVGPRNEDNREAIEKYGRVVVVGEMPRFDPLSSEALAAWATTKLDPGGQLSTFLQ